MSSGLYQKLVEKNLLVSHEETDLKLARTSDAYKVLKPEQIPFISYPYEWSFGQLKSAALATMRIQKLALSHGMSLKDASAYNIQFLKGKPVFIDTLSFEAADMKKPWVAYRQFCQHFLAPLALMALTDIRMGQLMKIYIDGIPLDLASRLLPKRSRLNFALLSHIHLHAKSQKSHSDSKEKKTDRAISELGYKGLMDSLIKSVKKLSWEPKGTEWAEYYTDTNYTEAGFDHKKEIITGFIKTVKPANVWDLGANLGEFSRLASDMGIPTVSFDIDESAVEKNYKTVRKNKETHILPLLLDLTNPSPGVGWENEERFSLSSRGPVDMIFALALIHHLAISNNLPLEKVASYFATLCKHLVIEFVPKEDSQVKRLLLNREDIFPHYTQKDFETAFKKCFTIKKSESVKDSCRTLYLMSTK